MSQEEKETKINAIRSLMEFSLLLTEEDKEIVNQKVETFTDEEINGLGTLLAIEHRNRDQLDQKMLADFLTALEKYSKS